MISLPSPIIEAQSNGLRIIRDDVIEGGTKTRALLRWLPTLQTTHVVYAGSVFGSGGWAVAVATKQLDIKATILMSRSSYIPPWADEYRNVIHWTDPLPVSQLHAMGGVINGAYNLPLGFDQGDFIGHLTDIIAETLTTPPPEIWVPALSGVLARAVRRACPASDIHVVTPARYPGPTEGLTIHKTPEKYHQPARTPPPYPACPFSDAKVWQFAEKMAVDGAFIWNVSR